MRIGGQRCAGIACGIFSGDEASPCGRVVWLAAQGGAEAQQSSTGVVAGHCGKRGFHGGAKARVGGLDMRERDMRGLDMRELDGTHDRGLVEQAGGERCGGLVQLLAALRASWTEARLCLPEGWPEQQRERH